MPHTPRQLQEQRYQNLLDEVEARLAEAAQERYGHHQRGRQKIFAMLRAEAPSGLRRRRVSGMTAKTELNSLIYQRHALRHGYFRLTEMNRQQLAVSLLGPEAAAVGNVEMETFQARVILKEQWRYGHSPLLQHFRKKVQERLDREQRIKVNYCRKQAVQVMKDFHRKWRQWEGERQQCKDQQERLADEIATESATRKTIGRWT